MLFTQLTYIGIDPSSGSKAIAYAALNQDLRPIALGHGNLDDVLSFVGGQQNAFVAVNAPQKVNTGVLAKLDSENPVSPAPVNIEDYRLAEYELWKRGIRTYHTPANQKDCKPWMRTGFLLYQRLRELAYQPYPAQSAGKQFAEVPTHACYSIWLEQIPFPKRSLEGRLQRQLVLYDLGLQIPDPMRFFEEITRHRLLQGRLPAEILYSAAELEVLAAALAAWTAVNRPEQVILLGQADEGRILLPTEKLREHYNILA